VTAKAMDEWLIYMDGMTFDMTYNTITLNDNEEFYGVDIQKKGLLSSGTAKESFRIEDNKIICDSGNTSYLFNLATVFSMKGNEIIFSPNSKLVAVINYNPSAEASSGDTCEISDNIVGDLDEVANENVYTNTDYLVRFYTSSTFTYPQIEITDNVTFVNLRLVNRASASRMISSHGDILIDSNKIYSELNIDEATIIDQKVNESNLILGADNLYIENEAVAAAVAEEYPVDNKSGRRIRRTSTGSTVNKSEADALEAYDSLMNEMQSLMDQATKFEEEANRLADAEKVLGSMSVDDTAAREAEANAQAAMARAEAAARDAAAHAAAAEQAAAQAEEAYRIAAEAGNPSTANDISALMEAAQAMVQAKAAAEEAARFAAIQAEDARLAAIKAEDARLEAEEAKRIAAEELAKLGAAQAEAEVLATEQAAKKEVAEETAKDATAAVKQLIEAAARAAAEKSAVAQAEAAVKAAEVAKNAAAVQEAERLAAEKAAAAEAAERANKEEAARIEREETARIAAEQAEIEALERAAAKAAEEELARIEAENVEKEKSAEENEKKIIPTSLNEFSFYTTKDGYLVLLFSTEVNCNSDKCVTVDGKSYTTKQYEKNSILVNVTLGQLNNSFIVSAKVIVPEISTSKAQVLTKVLRK